MKNRIREMRISRGITQEELARQVGVRRETIVFLEQGKYNPSLRLALDIAKFFKLKVEAIFLDD